VTIIHEIRKKLKVKQIDRELLYIYNNPDSSAVSEFVKDCEIIHALRKSLKKVINEKANSPFLSIYNQYITLRNIFHLNGLIIIGIKYFTESEKLFEYYNSLLFYFDGIKMSNRRSTEFLKWLEKENPFKYSE